MEYNLKKILGIKSAVALAIGMVIGAGLLVLPGIAYSKVGGPSIFAWAICSIIVIPLLVIFSDLGSKFPGAGGISGFVKEAFGNSARSACECLLIGTFSLGIPAIALVGGDYISELLGLNPNSGPILGIIFLLISGILNFVDVKFSDTFQKIIAIALVLLLILIPLFSIFFGDFNLGEGISPINDIDQSFPVIGTIFFAFTGWEMLSFTTGEFKNPKRDFPLAVAISFFIVIVIYFSFVLALQYTVAQENTFLEKTPLLALLNSDFPVGIKLVSIIAGIIIFANINSAIWASSRLVYSSSKEGLLPGYFSKVDSRTRTPRKSVLLTLISFLVVEIALYLKVVDQEFLLTLAGINFFILYLLSVLSYISISKNVFRKTFGILTLILAILIMGTFGKAMIYPAILLIIGFVLGRRKKLSTVVQ